MPTMPFPYVIGFSNHKGGVAKTTSCANIAYGLSAFHDFKVLCIDMDPQGHLTQSMGISPEAAKGTTKDILDQKSLRAALPQQVADNLWVIPATLDLSIAELGYIGRPDWQYLLKKAISRVKEEYDIILLDCPPTLSLLTTNALTAANYLIIPVQCEGFAMGGLAQLLQTVDLIRESTNEKLEILGVLPTRFDARKRVNREVLDLLPTVGDHRFAGLVMDPIPDNIALAEAGPLGQSIYAYRKDSLGAKAYAVACNWVVHRLARNYAATAILEVQGAN